MWVQYVMLHCNPGTVLGGNYLDDGGGESGNWDSQQSCLCQGQNILAINKKKMASTLALMCTKITKGNSFTTLSTKDETTCIRRYLNFNSNHPLNVKLKKVCPTSVTHNFLGLFYNMLNSLNQSGCYLVALKCPS